MCESKKTCQTCQQTMSIRNFARRGQGFKTECKKCYKTKMQEWRRTPYGFLSTVYTSLMRSRKGELMDRCVFYDYMVGMESFQRVYKQWEMRDFRPCEKPILVLDNPALGYEVANIRWFNKKELYSVR